MSPALEPIFGDQPRIERPAAWREGEPVELGKVEGKLGSPDAGERQIDGAGQRVADHLRLLVDLLGHKMAVVALVDQESRGQRSCDWALHRVAAPVADGDPF